DEGPDVSGGVERRPHYGCTDGRVVDAAARFVRELEECLVESLTARHARVIEILVFVFKAHVAIERERSQPREVFNLVGGVQASRDGGQRDQKRQAEQNDLPAVQHLRDYEPGRRFRKKTTPGLVTKIGHLQELQYRSSKNPTCGVRATGHPQYVVGSVLTSFRYRRIVSVRYRDTTEGDPSQRLPDALHGSELRDRH